MGCLKSYKKNTINAALILVMSASMSVFAGPKDQAKRIHERLTGVPPDQVTLDDMATMIEAGDPKQAAMLAMDNEAFYSVTLKNWAAPWTNRDHNVFVPLNDYIATVIGLVKDDADFRRVLYDDVVYYSNQSGLPSHQATNNNAHYEAIENNRVSLIDTLVPTTQSSFNGLPSEATAGIMTSRAAAKSFFIDGTNRAMLRFTLVNHLCKDLEDVHDISRPPNRIRQDVSRSPGGDSRVFLNGCVGCHSGMDPLAQAFAYYDYEYNENDEGGQAGRIHYNDANTIDPDTQSRVEKKYRINSTTFNYGFVTPDDSWTNYWREGPNVSLMWSSSLPGEGQGAKSLGEELANSRAFAQCQVQKVFKTVCLRDPMETDQSFISDTTDNFTNTYRYNLREVFADTASFCRGN